MKAVCIGVHVHAEPERLQATLHSLQEYTRQGFALLLLPDGPDNATKNALGRLTHLPQSGTAEPLGPPACFNRLTAFTGADILVLLESGTLVGPGWLDYLLAALAADPFNGLAGPSTNHSWNEQGVFPHAGGTPAEVVRTAKQAAQRFGTSTRMLEPLYSLGDFCYVVRREVVQAIGAADERYGMGPCWEMDYNIRAARAGFRGVWACGAYVYRAPFTARRRREEAARFEASRHLYQDKFCGLRLRGEKTSYEPHCRGEACEHFAPTNLITIRPDHNTTVSETNVGMRSSTPASTMEMVYTQEPSMDGPNVPPDRYDQSRPDVEVGNEEVLPLVSCIMPTRNRRAFVQQALLYFERQDYPNKELIIIDDGDDRIGDLVANKPHLRYKAVAQKLSIGAKRNLACELAQGAIIAHWDDDDWYAPHRLSYQVAPLLAGQADITGLETACFFDLQNWQAWACSPVLHRRLFVGDVHGGSLVYWHHIWKCGGRYPDVSLAEDARFLQFACRRGARLRKLAHAQCFIYLRHERNAWRFPLGSYLDSSGWQKVDLNAFLPEKDQAFYRNLSPQSGTTPAPVQHGMITGDQRQHQDRILVSERNGVRPVAAVDTNFEQASGPSMQDTFPLISCIMPTYNRQRYVEQSICYFLRQDYPNRELIILDDSPQAVDELIPADPRIRYIHLEARMILGAKRNLACRLAHGSIIAHWDDDDWIAPHRLRVQVELLERQRAELCGTYRQLYYDSENHHAWLYEYPHVARRLPLGNTLCYHKSLWERNPFPEIAVGEDTRFVWSRQVRHIAFLNDHSFYVGLIHRGNTSRKILTGACWHSRPVEEVSLLLGPDIDFYLQWKA